MFTCYLGIGSNEGNKLVYIESALQNIQSEIGEISKKSSYYETKAWGIEDQANFFNLVIEIKTNLLPITLLQKILKIETVMGRRREVKWGKRIIDIDILFFENYHFNLIDLQVPHPFLEYRNFVLSPLNDICPDYKHPKLKKTISQLNIDSNDKSWIKKI